MSGTTSVLRSAYQKASFTLASFTRTRSNSRLEPGGQRGLQGLVESNVRPANCSQTWSNTQLGGSQPFPAARVTAPTQPIDYRCRAHTPNSPSGAATFSFICWC